VKDAFWSRRALRRHLLAGLVVIAPITATLFVLWWIFQLLDGLLGRFLYPLLHRVTGIESIPGLGLVVLLLLLVTVGWAAEQAIGSRIARWWNDTLERIPVARRIYGAANRIVRSILGQGSRPFAAVVLVEFPAEGRWSVGFLASRAPDAMLEHVPGAVSVFIPTSPNPTTGFLIVVPETRARILPFSVDQAFTFILSAGTARPDVPPGPAAPGFQSPEEAVEAVRLVLARDPHGPGRP
jgi:uncharacterized membrane protein